MSNEEFQKLVLQKLGGLDERMGSLEVKVDSLDEKVNDLNNRVGYLETEVRGLKTEVSNVKVHVESIDSKLDAVYKQTAVLTEFKTEVSEKLDNIIENNKSMYELLGEHEIAIRTLRRRPV